MISINLLILFGIRRNCLRSGRSRSLYLSIRRTIEQIVVIIGAYHFCQLRTKCYPTSCSQGKTPYAEEIIGDHQCGFRRNKSTNEHIYCAFVKYLRKGGDKAKRLGSHPVAITYPRLNLSFHCPTLESMRVSTVARSILTCYKCLATRKVIAPSAQWLQETRVTTGCAKICVILSAYAASL